MLRSTPLAPYVQLSSRPPCLTKVWHAGTANTAAADRPVLSLGFAATPRAALKRNYRHNAASLPTATHEANKFQAAFNERHHQANSTDTTKAEQRLWQEACTQACAKQADPEDQHAEAEMSAEMDAAGIHEPQVPL